MGWFSDALDYSYGVTKDYVKNIIKDPAGTMLTMGIKPAVDTAEKKVNDYKESNGGRQAREFTARADKEAADLASKQATEKLAIDSAAAGARYGGGGASDPFNSLTNNSIMSPNKKKSILGGF